MFVGKFVGCGVGLGALVVGEATGGVVTGGLDGTGGEVVGVATGGGVVGGVPKENENVIVSAGIT